MNNAAEQREIATVEREPAQFPAARQEISPMSLLSMAVEKDAPIEKLEKLLALQERWEANEAKKAFDQAMADFKAKAPSITKNHRVTYKNKNGDETSYIHATLDNICTTINPVLGEAGLSYTWDTLQESGTISVTCIVSHRMGHSKRTTLASVPDTSGGKNGIQAVGSTVTYLQRYTLLAALGLATEGQDDDGVASGDRGQEQQEQQQPTHTQQLPDYPKDRFDKGFPGWQASIKDGSKKPEDVITTISTRFTLSDQQKKQIRDCAAKEGEIV